MTERINRETGARYARLNGSVVNNRVSDECIGGAHDDCHFLWCTCLHHSAVQFAIEHAQIPLHQPIAEDDEESEAA